MSVCHSLKLIDPKLRVAITMVGIGVAMVFRVHCVGS